MARIYAAIALANVAANFVLIPLLSLNGAALNTVAGEALIVGALLAAGVRSTGPLDWERVLAGPVIAAAVSAGVMALLRDQLALAAGAGAVAYVAVLLAFESRAFPDDAAQIVYSVRTRAHPRSP
jgi:O-antigen/teichoic acid export membrane protein